MIRLTVKSANGNRGSRAGRDIPSTPAADRRSCRMATRALTSVCAEVAIVALVQGLGSEYEQFH